MYWDSANKRYFNTNYRNLKETSTQGMPDPNGFANSMNTGNGNFNEEIQPSTPKRKRSRRNKSII